MDMRNYSAQNFVKFDNLADGPLEKTIASIEPGSFDKPQVGFEDGSKLSLNRTSVLALSRAFGWDSAEWIGRRVEIYSGAVTFKGTSKPSILVRPINPPAPQKPRAGDEFNDDVTL